MTNYEKKTQVSLEELANVINENYFDVCRYCIHECEDMADCRERDCVEGIRKWLELECEE